MDRCTQVQSVAAGIPTSSLRAVLEVLADGLTSSPHLEFVLNWIQALCTIHGGTIQSLAAKDVQPSLRALHRVVAQVHEQLCAACDSNLYTLQYLSRDRTQSASVKELV